MRLHRPAILAVAAVMLAGILAPSTAVASWADECFPETCGGGGGGGYTQLPTSMVLSTPAASPYTSVAASATMQPVGAMGYISITMGASTYTTPDMTSSASTTFGFTPSFIGQSVAVSGAFTGDNYVSLPSSATGTPVYLYGSAAVGGSIQLNGQAVSGATVALVSGTGTVASTTTNGSGGYSLSVNPVTKADAEQTYAVRATIGGTDYYYNGGTSTTLLASATLGGPTQWRPGVAWDISASGAPVWPATTERTPAVGVAFSTFLGATSNLPVTYSIFSGTLPAGLSLNATTGEVSGTATGFGNKTVVFTASNGVLSSTSSISFRVDGLTAVTVSAPVVAPYTGFTATATVTSAAGTPTGNVQVMLSDWQTLVNGSSTFALVASSGLVGLNVSLAALYSPTSGSGYVASSSSSNVYLYASDSVSGTLIHNGQAVDGATITLESTAGLAVASTTTDASGHYTLSPSAPTTVTAAKATYRVKAALPGGATAYYVAGSTATSAAGTSATATLSGPTQWMPSVEQAFFMTTAPRFSDDTLATPRIGSVYSDGVAAADTATVFYTVSAGTLPAGLSLNSATGAITGTPTSMDAATFTLRAASAPVQYGFVEKQFTLTPLRAGIVPSFTDSTLDRIIAGQAVTDGVAASGDPTISYSVFGGALPAGLALSSSSGAITGTTTATGSFTATIRATNEFGHTDVVISGTVYRASLTLTGVPATMPYSGTNMYAEVWGAAATPTGTVLWTVLGSTYPSTVADGASIFFVSGDETDVGSMISVDTLYTGDSVYAPSSAARTTYVYGTDTVSGLVTENGEPVEGATVRVHDGSTVVGETITDEDGRYTVTVDASTVALVSATYTISATVGSSVSWYSAGSVATSATPGVAIATASGPTQWRPGVDQDIHFTTAPTWTDAALATPRQGTAYTDAVSAASPGVAAEYEISLGTLPSGLGLDPATGAITGTPTDMVTTSFTVRAFTVFGEVTKAFTLTPLRPGIAPTFTDETLGGFAVDVAFGDAVGAGGDPTITYSLLGLYPAGIVIDAATGVLSGTPLYNGPYSFQVRATNDFGFDEAIFIGWVDAVPVADVNLGFSAGDALGDATMTIEADGLELGSDYTLTMFSTPRVLFSGTVGAFRSFSHVISLPADTPAGAHRLELSAVAADGTVITVTAYFTLLANGRIGAISYSGALPFTPAALRGLASTGSEPLLPLGVGAVMLVAGFLILRRRRQNA